MGITTPRAIRRTSWRSRAASTSEAPDWPRLAPTLSVLPERAGDLRPHRLAQTFEVFEIRGDDWLQHRNVDNLPEAHAIGALGQDVACAVDGHRQDGQPRRLCEFEAPTLEAPDEPVRTARAFGRDGERQAARLHSGAGRCQSRAGALRILTVDLHEARHGHGAAPDRRSEEHTSELQSRE